MYEAYAAVERSYSQGRYDEALNQAQGLLASLDANPEDPLRPRLLLLVGHCHLYGLADPQRAASAYQEVLDHCREPVLREIAEEGLGHCAKAAPPIGTEVGTAINAPGRAADRGEASPAMPWLSQIDASMVTTTPPQAALAPFQASVEAATKPASDLATQVRAEPLPEPRTEPLPEPKVEARSVAQPEPEPEPIAHREPKVSEPEVNEPELIIPELVAEPEPPARPSSAFTREEEEDLARGLLLVEL